MGKKIRYLLLMAVFMTTAATTALADETQTPPVNEPAQATTESSDEPLAPPNPDVRALSPDELNSYQTESDSLAQNGQLQQMDVGAGIDGTIVLSVLVALLIFAVIVAVL